MKATLKLGVSQHLTLTPQLQQSIRFLQLSTLELEQELAHLAQTNPLLELEEVATETAESPLSEEEGFSLTEIARTGSANDDDELSFENRGSKPLSLYDWIKDQVSLLRLNDNEKALVLFLADALNENGYLTTPLEDLLASIPEDIVIDEDELHFALKCLQSLEPAGIGARDLRECLLLQLKTLSKDMPAYDLAETIVQYHLPLLAAKDFAQLKRKRQRMINSWLWRLTLSCDWTQDLVAILPMWKTTTSRRTSLCATSMANGKPRLILR